MRNALFSALVIALPLTGFAAAPAFAEKVTPIAATIDAASPSGDFVRKSKRIKGGYTVEQRGNQTVIVFSDTFIAANGPDLKVFLSPQTVKDVKGKTAVNGAVLLGELTKTRGTQEYVLPAGVSINDFKSVLVHCEEFAVLWGAAEI